MKVGVEVKVGGDDVMEVGMGVERKREDGREQRWLRRSRRLRFAGTGNVGAARQWRNGMPRDGDHTSKQSPVSPPPRWRFTPQIIFSFLDSGDISSRHHAIIHSFIRAVRAVRAVRASNCVRLLLT